MFPSLVPTKTTLLAVLTSVLDIHATTVLDSMASLLKLFDRSCKDPLEGTLPPMRHIQHQIRLQLGTSIPNLPHYRMAHVEYDGLWRLSDGLVVQKFLSEKHFPLVVPALLTPKKRWVLVYVC